MFLFLSITLIVPAFLDPKKILPRSLSVICLGVSTFSTNISISKPDSTIRLSNKFEEALIVEGKETITIK